MAVVGVDDLTALVAALAAEKLALPHNPPEAVAAARRKATSREKLQAAGIPVPRFEVVRRDLEGAALDALLSRAPYPCVVKPLILSGSRGVIRANDRESLRTAIARVAALLRSPDVAQRRDPDLERVLIEEFVPGPEVALEGLLIRGRLHVLALFDKPDPLDGPFFEETLYVTPSRAPAPASGFRRARDRARLRCAGPPGGSDPRRAAPVAAGSADHGDRRAQRRRALRARVAVRGGGHAGRADPPSRDGAAVEPPPREKRASGVLMLPIRRRGVLEEVRGVEEARRVPLIEDVVITAHLREELIPLPEGGSYLGFAFAHGDTPEQVERGAPGGGRAHPRPWSYPDACRSPELDPAPDWPEVGSGSTEPGFGESRNAPSLRRMRAASGRRTADPRARADRRTRRPRARRRSTRARARPPAGPRAPSAS